MVEHPSILLMITEEQGPSHWTYKMRPDSAAVSDSEKSFCRYHTLEKISEKKQIASALCHPKEYLFSEEKSMYLLSEIE